MKDVHNEFLATLPEELKQSLDYSSESLVALEHWLKEEYSSSTDLYNLSNSLHLDGAARYVGEVFLKQLGGSWDSYSL